MTYPIQFVSLGPGEPELITVKGLKILQKADRIYYPATQNKSGLLISRASDILHALGIPVHHLSSFLLPMSKNRAEAKKAYEVLYEEVCRQSKAGKLIAIVAEGDAGFYSSIQYLYDKLVKNDIAVHRVAGIPAFIAAGALAGLHIAKQEEKIMIVPGSLTEEELSAKIEAGYVIVIMKLSQCTEAVHNCIQKHPASEFHYFENVGTAKEYYTSDKKNIRDKIFPYFSLMIIQ